MFARFSRRSARWLFCGFAVVACFVLGSPAAAHTGFESSSPADGEVVDVAVSEVVVRFTGEATVVGDGFTILDPDGLVRSPSSVTTEDNKVFVLHFEPPLAGGSVGVRWMVQAQDAHPIDGAFSFTVSAPVVTTTAPTTTAPTTTVEPATTGAPATSAPSTTVAVSSTPVSPAADGIASIGGVSLEEFLAADSSTPGEGRQLIGRVIVYLGVVGALGGLGFLALTLRGTRREIVGLLRVVAVLGLLTAVGAAVEYWGWLAQSEGSFVEELTPTPGLAMTLRFAGGLVIGGAILFRVIPRESSSRSRPAGASASELQSWSPRTSPLVVVGAALLVSSFWFDGHTVSEGPRGLHALVNSVHVVAASVWAGGVVALTGILMVRRRRGEPGRAAELLVRFSSIAAVSLAAVALAGVLLTVFVLDSVGELTSTEWGKALLVKNGAVAVAVLGGAYNHFRLRPALEASPDDARLEAEFRSTLQAEAIVLLFVVVVTAWLVAAAI